MTTDAITIILCAAVLAVWLGAWGIGTLLGRHK